MGFLRGCPVQGHLASCRATWYKVSCLASLLTDTDTHSHTERYWGKTACDLYADLWTQGKTFSVSHRSLPWPHSVAPWGAALPLQQLWSQRREGGGRSNGVDARSIWWPRAHIHEHFLICAQKVLLGTCYGVVTLTPNLQFGQFKRRRNN